MVNGDAVRQAQDNVVAAVVIVIADGAPVPLAGGVEAGFRCDIGKAAASRIAIKRRRAAALPCGQQQIWPAVGVEIDETCAGAGKLFKTIRHAGCNYSGAPFRKQSAGNETDREVLRRSFCAAGRAPQLNRSLAPRTSG